MLVPAVEVGVSEGTVGDGEMAGEGEDTGEEDTVGEAAGVDVVVVVTVGEGVVVGAGVLVEVGDTVLGAEKPGTETGGTGIVCCPFTVMVVAREMNTAIPRITIMMTMMVSVPRKSSFFEGC